MPLDVARRLTDSHDSLVRAVGRLRELVDQLERGGPVARPEAERGLDDALTAATHLRQTMAEAERLLERGPAASDPASAEQLGELVRSTAEGLRRLGETLPRERLQRLAAALQQGRVSSGAGRARLEGHRQEAAQEVSDGLQRPLAELSTFPGPPDPEHAWLHWFWGLEVDAQERIAGELEPRWPKLHEFLTYVSQVRWRDPSDEVTGETALPPVATPTEPPPTLAPEPTPPPAPPPPSAPAARPPLPKELAPTPPPDEGPELDEETRPRMSSVVARVLFSLPPGVPPEERVLERSEEPEPPPEALCEAPPAAPSLQEAPATPPPRPWKLPELDEYISSHWVRPDGSVDTAPWKLPGWGERAPVVVRRRMAS